MSVVTKINRCAVSLDSLGGDSTSWIKREKELEAAGFKVIHVPIYTDIFPMPSFLSTMVFGNPNDVVKKLDWADGLRRIDQTVGKLKEENCEQIIGFGAGLGGNWLLLYMFGLDSSNALEGQGGWYPADLKHTKDMSALAAVSPHVAFPQVVTERGIKQIDFAKIDRPTSLAYGGQDDYVYPEADGTTGRMKLIQAAQQNPNLDLELFPTAGHLFMHEDMPMMPFGWNPFYDEAAADQAWKLMSNWIDQRTIR